MQLRVTINDILCPELAEYLESCPPGKRSSALVALANRACLESLAREATQVVLSNKGKGRDKKVVQRLAKRGEAGQNISSPVGTGLQSSYSENQHDLKQQNVSQSLEPKALQGSSIVSPEPCGAVMIESEAGSKNPLSVSVDALSTERNTDVNVGKSDQADIAKPEKRFRFG